MTQIPDPTNGQPTGLLARWARRRRVRASINELQGLSDATLRDIGLHRGDIAPRVRSLHDLS